jgi:hypothetical protein
LWPTFQAGDLLLADRNFSSYGSIASLKQPRVRQNSPESAKGEMD